MKLYGWVHLIDRSHIHITTDPNTPPILEGSCALKSIYHDERADKIVEGLQQVWDKDNAPRAKDGQ